MNITIIAPATARLDAATTERRAGTSGYRFAFTKSATGLRIKFNIGNGWFSDIMEIISVGVGRYALVRNGKPQGIVERWQLLAALRPYRMDAMAERDAWRHRECA